MSSSIFYVHTVFAESIQFSNNIFFSEQSTNKEYAFTIERLNKLADGHSKDIEILRQNESELLALNEKLSFSNVILQNEISLHQSKSLAIAIENDSVKKSQVEYEGNVQRLVDKINLDRKNLAEERLTVATHVTEKNRECEMLKKQLEQTLGDLDAVRKKNSLIVKVRYNGAPDSSREPGAY